MGFVLPGDEEVLEIRVPADGGTDPGTFLIEIETDDTDAPEWPWPESWPVEAEK